MCRPPVAGRVREAPLAAGGLEDVSGAVFSLVPAVLIAAARGVRQVLSTAAEEAPRQVVEQVTGKEHVDPGVATAVETGQQHGNYKGHVYGKGRRRTQSRC